MFSNVFKTLKSNGSFPFSTQEFWSARTYGMTYDPLRVSSEHLEIAFQPDLFQSMTLLDLEYHCICFPDPLRWPNLHQKARLVRRTKWTFDVWADDSNRFASSDSGNPTLCQTNSNIYRWEWKGSNEPISLFFSLSNICPVPDGQGCSATFSGKRWCLLARRTGVRKCSGTYPTLRHVSSIVRENTPQRIHFSVRVRLNGEGRKFANDKRNHGRSPKMWGRAKFQVQ